MNRAPTGNAPTGNNGGGSGNGSGLSGSSSLMAGLRGFNNDLVQQQQTSVPSTGGLHMNSVSTAQTVAPSGPGRVKQPPPGFDPLSMLNSGTSNGQPSSQRNLLSPDMGLLNLETLTSQLNMNAGFGAGHHNSQDLGGSSGGQSRHDSGQTGSGNGFGTHSGLLSNHHLHNGVGSGPPGSHPHGQPNIGLNKNENSSGLQHNRPQPFLLEKQQQQQNLSKDWQDGLRALLPNVNVSFGALPHGPPQPQNGTAVGDGHNQRLYPSQPLMNHEHHPHSQHERQMQRHQQQHQQHQHQQSRSGWNSVKSPHANDWTTLDPAIVSGQVADNLSQHNPGTGNSGTAGNSGLRSDSPPGWLKNNLDQLTGDSTGAGIGGRFGGLNGSGLISGLAGLGLGQGQPPIGHWGQPSPVMSNTPPPGFAMNRGHTQQQMGAHGQMQGQPQQAQQPHPFSALAGLGGGSGPSDRDPTLESELARLVRS